MRFVKGESEDLAGNEERRETKTIWVAHDAGEGLGGVKGRRSENYMLLR